MYLAVEVLQREKTKQRPALESALDELETVYAFLYGRVGNRADAEELTQEVALKALPRLREGAPPAAVRSYLYATARSVLAIFWSRRLRLRESELPEDVRADGRHREIVPSRDCAAEVARILDGLSPVHRRLLELRFLQGCSLAEVAREMGKTVGSVKVMQLRALRKAAALEAIGPG
jgi:RNA polymerase sigma-70 factor, ECF subfamily